MQCGKPNCACATDRASQHGPYYQLSWKEKGKTVSRRLPAEHATLYRQWIANRQRLQSIIQQMHGVHKRPTATCCRLKKPKKAVLNQGIFLPHLDNPGVSGHLRGGNAQNHLIFRGFSRCQKVATPCSILFHLLVPGGRWQTVMGIRNSFASLCSSIFHRRRRWPLLPPPSAVIISPRAFG